MEGKKNTGLVVVVALLCLLIGGVGGYFISANYSNKNEENNKSNTPNENITNNQNQTTVEDNKQSQCKYIKLKDVYNLTDEEKNKIIIALEDGKEPFIDKSTLKIVLDSKSQYIYHVDYETIKKEGAYQLTSFVWNEDGVYKYYGGGSGLTLEEYDNLVNTINAECNVEK